jgi:hypothetical protein
MAVNQALQIIAESICPSRVRNHSACVAKTAVSNMAYLFWKLNCARSLCLASETVTIVAVANIAILPYCCRQLPYLLQVTICTDTIQERETKHHDEPPLGSRPWEQVQGLS